MQQAQVEVVGTYISLQQLNHSLWIHLLEWNGCKLMLRFFLPALAFPGRPFVGLGL